MRCLCLFNLNTFRTKSTFFKISILQKVFVFSTFKKELVCPSNNKSIRVGNASPSPQQNRARIKTLWDSNNIWSNEPLISGFSDPILWTEDFQFQFQFQSDSSWVWISIKSFQSHYATIRFPLVGSSCSHFHWIFVCQCTFVTLFS